MSPELIGILGVGIGLLTAIIAVAGFNMAQINNSDKRTRLQIEQLRAETNQRFDQMQEETNQRFEEINRRLDTQDERLRGLELGQAHLAGQFDILKDYFMHQAEQG